MDLRILKIVEYSCKRAGHTDYRLLSSDQLHHCLTSVGYSDAEANKMLSVLRGEATEAPQSSFATSTSTYVSTDLATIHERVRTVPPEGALDAPIVFIGEAPSYQELEAKRPFVGPAGQLFSKLLSAAGIVRQSCYITNLFKFQVSKDADGSIYHNRQLLWSSRNGFTALAKPYVQSLQDELRNTSAAVIVPLGKPAAQALLTLDSIIKWRGSVCNWEDRKVLPTIHPAAALRNYIYSYFILFDFKKAKRESASPTYVPPDAFRTITIIRDLHQFDNALALIESRSMAAFDVEIMNHEISVLGFGHGADIFVLPFMGNHGNCWSLDEEVYLWRELDRVLFNNPRMILIGQNIIFDLWMIARSIGTGIKATIADIMVMHHILYPDFPKGLDTLASVYTPEPYYKDDGKQWFKVGGGDWEKLYRYNGSDVFATFASYQALHDEYNRQPEQFRPGYWSGFSHRMALYPALLYMQMRGIPASIDQLALERIRINDDVAKLQAELNALCGTPLNVNSPKQVQQYFYITKGVEPYIDRKTHRPTVNDEALRRLARGTRSRKGYREASLIQEIRALLKLKSTYIDIEFDPDHRMRCAYNPAGTSGRRISSSQTLFGTGANMQNLPPRFKRFLHADPGCMLFELDKRQAEWIVTAFLAEDPSMIAVHEKSLDAHVETAHLAFGVPRELILREKDIIGHTTNKVEIYNLRAQLIPEILNYQIPSSMACRQAGKKANHGFNYNMQPDRFSRINEVDIEEAQLVYDGYHKAYKGIRNNFYPYVERCYAESQTLVDLFGIPRRFLDRYDNELLNLMYSHIPHSTVAEVVNRALTATHSDLTDFMHPSELLAQVHDSVLGQYHLSQASFLDMAKAILRIKQYLDPELEFKGRKFVIATDLKVGLNWGELSADNPCGMHELKLPNDPIALAQLLESTYAEMSNVQPQPARLA